MDNPLSMPTIQIPQRETIEKGINMYIVARIHNNALGKVIQVEDEAKGIETVKEWAADQFGRSLTDEEIYNAENELEIYNEDDADNIFCFSVGIVE